MTRNSYSDELMRAAARPDAAELREIVSAYHRYSKLDRKEKDAFVATCADSWETFYRTHEDPDLGLALVALAASMYDDPEFLFLVAAGPLEDILQKPSRETIDRVATEARKNARMRWMLTGVFLHAISDETRLHIVAAIDGMTENDPMPPRSN